MVDDDDILFAMIGSIGNPVLVKKDREFCIKNMALFKRFANTDISMRYVYWFLFYAQYKLKKKHRVVFNRLYLFPDLENI